MEYKGDYMPLGVYENEEISFSNKELQFMENDIIYLFSDGYVDQIGGPDRKTFRAQLFGHYIWWNSRAFFDAKYDDFIWDLNLNYKIQAAANTAVELFLTGHNLFNGDQFTLGDNQNPRRWAEGGFRIKF